MKKALIFFWLVVLTACSPIYADPYAQVAAGQAAIQATEAARSAIALQATVDAGRFQDQATGTAGAFELAQRQTQVVVTAQAAQALETANSDAATSTAHSVYLATQTAYPSAATATAAYLNVIARRDREAELRSQWDAIMIPVRALFWPVFWVLIFVLLVAGVIFAYRRLMPVLEMRLRTIPRTEHGAPLFIFPNLAVDPDRLFGPALLFDKDGVRSTGHAPTPELQARITTQAQAVEAIKALPHSQGEQRRALKPVGALLPNPSQAPFINQVPMQASANIEIVDPSDVGNWLSEVEHKLLTERSAEE